MTYYAVLGAFLDCDKKNKIFSLLLAGFLISVFSCASTNASGGSPLYAKLTGNSKYRLLPTENIETPMDAQQFVTASYGGSSFQVSSWVKADKNGIDVTLVNELGANMGELSYRDGAVSFSSRVFPKYVEGEFIVADFQLCFYDALALRAALEDCGLSLIDNETGRRVFQGEKLIIEIEKRQNAVRFVNHLRGYAYTIEGDFE